MVDMRRVVRTTVNNLA